MFNFLKYLCLLIAILNSSESLFSSDSSEKSTIRNNHRGRNHNHHNHHHLSVVTSSTSTRDRKPNIVLILTDDQDVELGSLNFMPKTLRGIRDKGAEFRHAYVTTPMCCPSRSSLLTGMYVHNHNVYTNNDNCSSTQWQTTYETRSFATYLSNAGYRTGYFGKYLNKYNGSYIPPGWREWGGLIMNSKYYNYSVNMNGRKIKHGFDYAKDYYPDLVVNDSIAFLRQSKKYNNNKPVMLTMSFPSPHGPEDSAPQFSKLFFNVTTHHTPSYDHAPNPDKQWILKFTNKMKPIHKEFTDLLMTKRLQTLQSVDSAVERVVKELQDLGELDNTYIIYTSDHGYHLGQFGLIKGKSFPFEFDVRVPFLVRGPGVDPGTVVDDIVLNIDLAPTFLHIAGIETPSHMDGRSVLPLFLNSKRKKLKWPDTFLIESSGRREPASEIKARANKYFLESNLVLANESLYSSTTVSYAKSSFQPPLFDSFEDEDETDDEDEEDNEEDEIEEKDTVEENRENRNLDFNSPVISSDQLIPLSDVVQSESETQLDNRLTPQLPPAILSRKAERLEFYCRREKLQLPCRSGQKWYCQVENGRWRKHKCKLQIPLPESTISKNYKRCACFTQDGVVYKKVHINSTENRPRLKKRDSSMFVTKGKQKILNFRTRRDTLRKLDTEMRHIKYKLSDLEQASVLPTVPSNSILNTNTGCVLLPNGQINCTNLVYKNKRAWKMSKDYVDNEIYKLRMQLENLKKFRKRLKHAKPSLSVDQRYELGLVNSRKSRKQWDTENTKKSNTTTGTTLNTTELNKFAFGNVTTVAPENTHKPVNHHRHNKRKFNINQRQNKTVNFNASSTTSKTTTDIFDSTTEIQVEGKSTDKYQGSTSTVKKTTKEIVTTLKPLPTTTVDVEVYETLTNEVCHCDVSPKHVEKDLIKEEKRKQKEERLKKKERKMRKKAKLEKECLAEKMNCFSHDNEHWRTKPMWTSGPFCFCMNANNNTYSCIRTINATHNFLYCEFVTGFVTFYNLRIDPFELQNRIKQLKPEERSYLHDTLKKLLACKGRSCTIGHNHHLPVQRVRSHASESNSKRNHKFPEGNRSTVPGRHRL